MQWDAFNDLLWYTDSALTIYVYPVLGKTACPSTKPVGCSDAERVPVTLMVAGPDTVVSASADSANLSWYQPPWISGNVLSYPGTLGQLKAGALGDPARFLALSKEHRWLTDNTEANETATWTNGSDKGSTASLNQNYSFNNTTSLTLSNSAAVFSASATLSLSLSGSFGFSNLTDFLTTLTQSTGLGFTKQAEFRDPATYGYWVTPYIFAGHMPPTADSVQPAGTDLQGFGTLQSGFVVDLLASGAGTVWSKQYGSAPDLALLHPSRMTVDVPNTTPAGDTDKCLKFAKASVSLDCASVEAPEPSSPHEDRYHHMRGFFISGAEAAGQGPMLGSARPSPATSSRSRRVCTTSAWQRWRPTPASKCASTAWSGTPRSASRRAPVSSSARSRAGLRRRTTRTTTRRTGHSSRKPSIPPPMRASTWCSRS